MADNEKIILEPCDKISFYLREDFSGVNYTVCEYIERGNQKQLRKYVTNYMFNYVSIENYNCNNDKYNECK